MGIPVEPPLLTGQTDFDRLLLMAGMHGVLDLEFTRDFAMHSPDDFVRIFMVEGLGVRTVVLGEDALFGRANAGTIDTMGELGRRYDFEVISVADLGPEGTTAGASPPPPSVRPCCRVRCARPPGCWAGSTPSPRSSTEGTSVVVSSASPPRTSVRSPLGWSRPTASTPVTSPSSSSTPTMPTSPR